jgi:peroxiredoxin
VGETKTPDAPPNVPVDEGPIKMPDRIGGIVKTPDDKPAASARVTVALLKLHEATGRYERFRRWETTTDDTGAYQVSAKDLDPLPPYWVLEIRADAEAWPEAQASFGVQTVAEKGRLGDVKFFRGVAVQGRILDPGGRPAKGVFLYQAGMINNSDAWVPTAAPVGDNGRFRITLPSESDGKVSAAELIAVSTNWAPRRVSLAAGADTNLGDIRLDTGTAVEGRLVDETNQPIADALIAARSNDYGQIPNLANQWTLAAKTNKDGSFRFASPMAGIINLWLADCVEAYVGGEIQLLRSNRPEVMVMPQMIDLDGKAPPTLKLVLRATPTVSIRGTARWADGKPAARVMVQSFFAPAAQGAVVPSRDVFTDAKGKYELRAPKGIEGFALMVGGRLERGVIYLPHPAGKKLPGRQTVAAMKFDRLDEPIDGVDWEMRVNEVRKAPAPGEAMNPAEAELKELDRAACEGMNNFLKQGERAKTDEERIGLLHSAPSHDDKLVKSLFTLERKHRGHTTGLMSLALVMRLAQADADPASAATKGRNQAVGVLAEHYAEHEDLDLCLERLEGGHLVLGFEELCEAALRKSPHPHVRAAALLYWATLLKGSAGLKTRLPSLLEELDSQPGEINGLTKTWLLALKPRVDAIDAHQALRQAAVMAQRVVDEYPNVAMIARTPDTDSLLVHRVAWSEGEPKTYAGQAERLLFELQNLSVGQTAPDFEGQDAERRKLKLSDLRGKVVVLMFSANWCFPCKKCYPILQDLQKKHADGRLAIVSILADGEVRTVKEAQEKREITWHALWDGPDGPIAERWNVQTYPTIYLLDSAGVIRARDIGAASLAEQIDKLLAASVK